jgi:predicted RNA-binding Zn ribbon-like protein
MATSTTDMRLSGGDPALDFVNTVDSRRGRWGPDLLRHFDDLIILASRTGLIDTREAIKLHAVAKEQPDQAEAELRLAITLREAIYQLFLAEDAQEPYPEMPFTILHERARHARARQVLSNTADGLQWLQPIAALTDLVDLFAWKASELLTSRSARRDVRECKGDNCGWLFLDTSKSGRRLWCSEASCGTHTRVKRFRQKRS